MSVTHAPALPSATVVLLRDTPGSLEVLLLQRNAELAFHGGSWVFPGGRVDTSDAVKVPHTSAANANGGEQSHPAHLADLPAARVAAVREVAEETGLRLDPNELVPFAHWTTPLRLPKRYSTWFFAARFRFGRVKVDGGEILAHRWLSPAAAIAARDAGELPLPPPTFVTLWTLREFASTSAALHALSVEPPRRYFPRPQIIHGGFCSLYPGDAGYEGEQVDAPGARHRLLMTDGPWRYEHSE